MMKEEKRMSIRKAQATSMKVTAGVAAVALGSVILAMLTGRAEIMVVVLFLGAVVAFIQRYRAIFPEGAGLAFEQYVTRNLHEFAKENGLSNPRAVLFGAAVRFYSELLAIFSDEGNLVAIVLLFDNDAKNLYLITQFGRTVSTDALGVEKLRVNTVAYNDIRSIRIDVDGAPLPDAGRSPFNKHYIDTQGAPLANPLTRQVRDIKLVLETADDTYTMHMFSGQAKHVLSSESLVWAMQNTDALFNAVCEVIENGRSTAPLLSDLPTGQD